MIRAHDGPLAAMSFDMTGAKIATASNKVCFRVIQMLNRFSNMAFSPRER